MMRVSAAKWWLWSGSGAVSVGKGRKRLGRLIRCTPVSRPPRKMASRLLRPLELAVLMRREVVVTLPWKVGMALRS